MILNFVRRLHISSWFLLVTLIFFWHWLTSSLIAIIFLTWAVLPGKKIPARSEKQYYGFYLGYYLVLVLGLFYSEPDITLAIMGRACLFFLLPLPFLFPVLDYAPLFKKLKMWLVGALVVYCLVSWGDLVVQLLRDGREFRFMFDWLYSEKYLGRLFQPDGIYWAIGLLLGGHFALERLIQNPFSSRWKNWALIFSLLVFALFTLHLASRMGLVILIVSTILYSAYFTIKLRKLKLLLIPVVFITVMISLALSMPWFRVRIIEYSSKPFQTGGSQVETRLSRWEAIWPIVIDNPLVGVGTGDAWPEMLIAYQARNQTYAVEQRYNAHNQYLQTLISSGIVGFVFLMGMLSFVWIRYFRKFSIFHRLIMLTFALAFLTESMLMRNHGILLFTLIPWMLLTEYSRPQET